MAARCHAFQTLPGLSHDVSVEPHIYIFQRVLRVRFVSSEATGVTTYALKALRCEERHASCS
jgi:hypothetical protein